MRRGRPKHNDILTPREWQVLRLVREGLTNEEIAGSLGISFAAAKYHVAEILSKLGVSSRHEAGQVIEEKRGDSRAAFLPLLAIFHRNRSWLPLRPLLSATLVAGAIAGVLAFAGLLQSGAAPPGEPTMSAIIALDVASAEQRAYEEAYRTTPYKRTILLTSQDPDNLGEAAGVIAGLPRVGSLDQLELMITSSTNLVVIDKSAIAGLQGMDALQRLQEDGIAFMGLNLTLDQLEALVYRPIVRLPPGTLAWETAPSGETRYFEAGGDDPMAERAAQQAIYDEWLVQSGEPFFSFTSHASLPELEELRGRGEAVSHVGLAGASRTWGRELCLIAGVLANLDAGAYSFDIYPLGC